MKPESGCLTLPVFDSLALYSLNKTSTGNPPLQMISGRSVALAHHGLCNVYPSGY